jgi:hypothetical protein
LAEVNSTSTGREFSGIGTTVLHAVHTNVVAVTRLMRAATSRLGTRKTPDEDRNADPDA